MAILERPSLSACSLHTNLSHCLLLLDVVPGCAVTPLPLYSCGGISVKSCTPLTDGTAAIGYNYIGSKESVVSIFVKSPG